MLVGRGGRGDPGLAGIACGTDCSETYSAATLVTLNAATRRGLLFSGWSGGGCTGTDACTVTLNADTTVTATFTPPPDRPVITLPLEDDVMAAAGGALPMTWTAVAGATQYGPQRLHAEEHALAGPIFMVRCGAV